MNTRTVSKAAANVFRFSFSAITLFASVGCMTTSNGVHPFTTMFRDLDGVHETVETKKADISAEAIAMTPAEFEVY